MTLFRATRNLLRLLILAALVMPLLAACGGVGSSGVKRGAFTSKEFGVSSSPRVTKAKYPPRGGGRYLPEKAYVVRGVTYQPVEGPGYVARGEASWYGQDFHGRRTANGEIFGAFYLTAASPVLPVPSYARVTNLENGRSVLVRVNDRGPYLQGRLIDLSYQAAAMLGYVDRGSAEVEVRYVGPAPLNGDDSRMLTASLNRVTRLEAQSDTRLAMAEDDGGRSSPGNSAGDLAEGLFSMFGYADSAGPTAAAAAAASLAGNGAAVTDLPTGLPGDGGPVHFELGAFTDPAVAREIATQFALLGAVDEDAATVHGHPATRLTVTRLKAGAEASDLRILARQLGLRGAILY